MIKAPTTVFKYRRFSEKTVSALCADTVYFSSATAFNDPLDCNPMIVSDSSLTELREVLKRLVERRVALQVEASLRSARSQGPKTTAYARRVAVREAEQELCRLGYLATDPGNGGSLEENENWLLTQQIEHELHQQYDRGICCFSTTDSHPLLWSHYGDEHRGFCLGYDLDRNPRPNLQKVSYGGSRRIMTSTVASAVVENNPESQRLLEQQIFLTKAGCWRYEREWRLIGAHGSQASPLRLKSVTFGLRCSQEVKHVIVSALDKRSDRLDLFEMTFRPGLYSMRRHRVELDELAVSLPRIAQSGIEEFGDAESV